MDGNQPLENGFFVLALMCSHVFYIWPCVVEYTYIIIIPCLFRVIFYFFIYHIKNFVQY